MKNLVNKAIKKYKKGDIKSASQIYKKILKSDPNHLDANYLLGSIYAETGNHKAALTYLEHAHTLRPDSPMINNNLGSLYRKLGQYEKAFRLLNRAMSLSPNNPDVLFNLGSTLKSLGDHEQALLRLKQATTINPSPDWLFVMADCYRLKGSLQEAMDTYKQILQLNNNHDRAKAFLALLSDQATELPEGYVRELFDHYSNNFEQHLTTNLEYRTPELLKELVDSHSKSGATYESALDIGCGTGLAGKIFVQKFGKLTGIDISEKMLLEAKKTESYDTLVHADIFEYLDQCTEPYDFVIAADVFVYIQDIYNLLFQLSNNIRPGGMLAFSTEHTEDESTVLNKKTFRYQHPKEVIETAARKNYFEVKAFSKCNLRKEDGIWVQGALYLMERNFS